jgi:hypothetical protein
MRICVIPDLHNRHTVANDIVRREIDNVDKFVFLGDYFDDFNENDNDIVDMCYLIKQYIHDDKFTFLIGNHDIQYIFANEKFRCTKCYTDDKFDLINNILSIDDWEKMQWVFENNRWLISHAGIRGENFNSIKSINDNINIAIANIMNGDKAANKFIVDLWSKDYSNKLLYVKSADFIYNQIHGHLSQLQWNLIQYVGYRVYQIDTFAQNYAIVDTCSDYVEVLKSGYVHNYHPKELKYIYESQSIN